MVVRRAQRVAAAAAVSILLTALFTAPVVCVRGTNTHVPIGLDTNGLVSVSALVDGTERVTMLLDTGSSRSILSASVARRLHRRVVSGVVA